MATATDRAPAGATTRRTGYAIDRGTIRTFDPEGRLRVADTPISKAAVNNYYGWEIGRPSLGLDADRSYRLLRDPEELAKAAPTFAGVQLLDEHVIVSAANPQTAAIVGSVGTDVRFDGTYLRASLIVWDADAIRPIESGARRQLSAAYSYDPEMKPGTWRGERYDGVIRNIRGNHVSLVTEGRAGPDVVVGDAAPSAARMMDVRRAAGRAMMRRIEAQRETRGILSGIALDGIADADQLYQRALAHMGIDLRGLPLPACRAVFRHLRGQRIGTGHAQDTATAASFAARFPNIARIRKA